MFERWLERKGVYGIRELEFRGFVQILGVELWVIKVEDAETTGLPGVGATSQGACKPVIL